jgi:chromosome segregation ATPase
LAYTYERPDLRALDDLEQMLRHLIDELATWRRRSIRAEAELQEVRTRGGGIAGPELAQARQRIVDLETENQDLRLRIDAARERLGSLAARLGFLEEDTAEQVP